MKVLFLFIGIICTANMLVLFILLENVRALRSEYTPKLCPPRKTKAQRENDEYSLFFDLGDISKNMRKRFKLSSSANSK